MKMKLKPSATINRRYLLLEGDKKEIEEVVLDYLGILGWARAAPVFLKNENGRMVLAVERKFLSDVKAAFELSQKKISVKKVSGTLKGLTA